MFWQELSWKEVSELDRELPVIIPLGSCEQHGHHLPLFVDTLQVDAVAKEIEKSRKEKVLLVPTLWLGSSDHHLDYSGTITVSANIYGEMIKQIAMCFLKHGFKRIFFLNGHGGNDAPATHALNCLVNESDLADDAHLVLSAWWSASGEAMKPEQHGIESPSLTHACEYETSMIRFIRPDLIKEDKVPKESMKELRSWTKFGYGTRLKGFKRFRKFTEEGHMGSPGKATAEKGESLFRAVTESIGKFVDDFATWPMMNSVGPKK